MKKYLIIILIFSFIFIFAEDSLNVIANDSIKFIHSDGVFPVNNRDYVPAMIKLFDNAQKTIHILMLEGRYYPSHPEGANRQLYNALFEAVKRGVEVIIIIDQAGYAPSQTIKNKDFGDFLAQNGVKVFYDTPDTTTHAKTLIIDTLYTVVGSTNWSYYALDKNNECSIVIKSSDVAKEYEKYFNAILELSHNKPTVLE